MSALRRLVSGGPSPILSQPHVAQMRYAARRSFTRATERCCIESGAGYLGSVGISDVVRHQWYHHNVHPAQKKTLFGPYLRLDHVNIVPGHCMKRRRRPRGILFLIRFTYSGSFIPPNQNPHLYTLLFSGTSKPTIALGITSLLSCHSHRFNC